MNSQASLITKDGVEKLAQHQSDQKQQHILDWLTPISYVTQQSDFLSRRQEGTGQWLLETDEFQQWMAERKKTLFCPGIPGAGKTILTSIVIDFLERNFQYEHRVGVAYLYCNFRSQNEQTVLNLLSSLLKQLGRSQETLPVSITNMYDMHRKKGGSRPSLGEIIEALKGTVNVFKRVFVVIDALDECSTSDGTRQGLLKEVFDLQDEAEINLFVTSRPTLDIENQFEGRSMSLEIRAKDADIRRYLDGEMYKLPLFVHRKPDIQEEIQNAIIDAVDGM
jgi:Cdc6-like AAA superfamily ATPase